ncbi:uncharacterized protein LOC126738890 isoform X1 [Anthonomus grandis grandis]|uniref:uncharacterized protein LOC126738890 isoform X1 n=1 Tax=Anthonomus grandis grandis TaxID=2921223 RepID=UPI002166AEE0|nr:uncharacterized protein LOC126738890 isoform X1 [Anthonomus grandis grandis]
MKFLVVATLAFAASVHGGGIILKGPSGVITPHGPIGPDGRGAGNAGGWNGGWNGAGAGWGGHGDGIILKGPSGAITKNGPIGPDALGLGAWNNGGWGGDDGQWHGHGAWNNGGWGGDDGQWHGDNGAWNGGWGGDDDGQWHGDNGAWNGGWGGDDGQWHGEGAWGKAEKNAARWEKNIYLLILNKYSNILHWRRTGIDQKLNRIQDIQQKIATLYVNTIDYRSSYCRPLTMDNKNEACGNTEFVGLMRLKSPLYDGTTS